MMHTLRIKLVPTYFDRPPFIKIQLNDQTIASTLLTQETLFTTPITTGNYTLLISLHEKTINDTILDANGLIISDQTFLIESVKIDSHHVNTKGSIYTPTGNYPGHFIEPTHTDTIGINGFWKINFQFNNAYFIEGHSIQEDLDSLANICDKFKPQRILEIGTHSGRTAIAMASARPQAEVFCVDIWTKTDGTVNDGWNKIFETFKKNISNYNINFFKGRSIDFFHSHQNERFDMVFIDGDHSFEGCSQDLNIANNLCKGVICGHDYSLPEVKRAADNFALSENRRLEQLSYNIFLIYPINTV